MSANCYSRTVVSGNRVPAKRLHRCSTCLSHTCSQPASVGFSAASAQQRLAPRPAASRPEHRARPVVCARAETRRRERALSALPYTTKVFDKTLGTITRQDIGAASTLHLPEAHRQCRCLRKVLSQVKHGCLDLTRYTQL